MKKSSYDPRSIRDKWNCDLKKLGKSWIGDLKGEVRGMLYDSANSIFDPERIMEFMRKSGLDFTGLAGSMTGKSRSDPYRILGVSSSASDDEIRARYRKLIWLLHPDTAQVKGTEKLFQEVMEAYETIGKERGWK